MLRMFAPALLAMASLASVARLAGSVVAVQTAVETVRSVRHLSLSARQILFVGFCVCGAVVAVAATSHTLAAVGLCVTLFRINRVPAASCAFTSP